MDDAKAVRVTSHFDSCEPILFMSSEAKSDSFILIVKQWLEYYHTSKNSHYNTSQLIFSVC